MESYAENVRCRDGLPKMEYYKLHNFWTGAEYDSYWPGEVIVFDNKLECRMKGCDNDSIISTIDREHPPGSYDAHPPDEYFQICSDCVANLLKDRKMDLLMWATNMEPVNVLRSVGGIRMNA